MRNRSPFMVFSHLRWNFVFQRPQHLISRCAHKHESVFWEEPEFRQDSGRAELAIVHDPSGVTVVTPQLPTGLEERQSFEMQRGLLHDFMQRRSISNPVAWYYTPMALNFSRDIEASAIVYDCMDELSAFRGAPPGLRAAEAELFSIADLVFTGGRSLYESKVKKHPSVHLFPSSIDAKHFGRARRQISDPPDQQHIPRPRLGYAGVIDERMDMELLHGVAELRPGWQLVMVGPVVKISETELAKAPNIHYLGGKRYDELPAYMSGWDIGMLPFALNDSTRFISPTKTPEYLAAGLPVVSTPIRDVCSPYGDMNLVCIAQSVPEFVSATEECLKERNAKWLKQVDAFLARGSWDRTWSEMSSLVDKTVAKKKMKHKALLPVRLPDAIASAD